MGLKIEVASNEDGGNWHHTVRLRGTDKILVIRQFTDRVVRDQFADELADMIKVRVTEVPWS